MHDVLARAVFWAALTVPAAAPAALPDPMRPPAALLEDARAPAPRLAAPAPAWVLSSTLISEERRVAVINDRLVTVGDRVLGAEVVAIGERRARLRYRGRDVLLELSARAGRVRDTEAGR